MQRTILRRVAVISILVGSLAGPAWAQESSYSAALTALSGGTARCGASFTFDDLGRQLTYRLTCDGLSSPATTLHLFGPNQSNVDMMIAVHSTPIVGTASLSPNEAATLKAGTLRIEVQTASRPAGEAGGRIAPK
jgi:hypothetical protein